MKPILTVREAHGEDTCCLGNKNSRKLLPGFMQVRLLKILCVCLLISHKQMPQSMHTQITYLIPEPAFVCFPGTRVIAVITTHRHNTHTPTCTLSGRLLQRQCSLLPCLGTTQLFSASPQG